MKFIFRNIDIPPTEAEKEDVRKAEEFAKRKKEKRAKLPPDWESRWTEKHTKRLEECEERKKTQEKKREEKANRISREFEKIYNS